MTDEQWWAIRERA